MPDHPAGKLTRAQIDLACQAQPALSGLPVSAVELTGGTQNETWLLEFATGSRAVLRAAPLPDAPTGWDDRLLLRREVSIYPDFQPLHSLMPRLLAVDFSHEILPRDYLLQTCLPGRRWADLDETLDPAGRLALWEQLGQITRRMHAITGPAFGYPPPAQSFARWSETVLDRFDHLLADFARFGLKTASLAAFRRAAAENNIHLDELAAPCLLHGDLWPFNVLIDGESNPPLICGILDAEHAWWGDPLADWGMFLLSLRADQPDWRAPIEAFQRGYGAALFRKEVLFRVRLYQGMHIALAMAQAARCADTATLHKGENDLRAIAQHLFESQS
ncbi:MAG: aminoglycoside phosphotransferase family protein [Anaerolineaceae bacterium]